MPSPFEKSGAIEDEAVDDDDGDKSLRRVPDDMPDGRNIGEMNDAGQQSDQGADRRAPAYAEAGSLPDKESDCNYKYFEFDQNDGIIFSKIP